LTASAIERAADIFRRAYHMNLWATVRDNVYELINQLSDLRKYVFDRDAYYRLRREFNSIELHSDFIHRPNVRKAALMIYLNKTCYNGLYRVDKSGKFNAAYGRPKSDTLFDEVNLLAISRILRSPGIELMCADFSEAVKGASEGDFIYLDPPYENSVGVKTFNRYTPDRFGFMDQLRLARTFVELDRRGCYVMMTNSVTYEMIRSLYMEYLENDVVRILCEKTQVSKEVSRRKTMLTYLIMNYNFKPTISPFIKETEN